MSGVSEWSEWSGVEWSGVEWSGTNTVEITMAVVHRHRVRTSLPQPLQCDSQPVTTNALQITMAITHRTAGAPSGDNARRSPFCSL